MITSAIKGTTETNGNTTTWEAIQLGIDGTEVVARKVRITSVTGEKEEQEEVLEEKVLASF